MFLASGGLAATAALAAGSATAATSMKQPGLFRRVDFTVDGLGLDPREYAARLQAIVARGDISADYYSNDGVIATLERTFARLLGKPAAMFVPTGTLANHLAVRTLAGDARRVLVQAESHLYNDSGDGAQTLSNLNLVPLTAARTGFGLEEVRAWVERSRGGRVRNDVGAISIETPVRRRDHAMVEFADLERISRYARAEGIGLHLDGARLFTLPQHSGRAVTDYSALFDTVYVSLWKHFNGSSGAILAGSGELIDGLHHVRRMFGGSSHEAWPLAVVALEHADTFQADYARAWQTADALIAQLEASGRFQLRRVPDGTSRVFLAVTGTAPQAFADRLRRHAIVLPPPHPQTGEFALQINPTLLRMPPDVVTRHFEAAARG